MIKFAAIPSFRRKENILRITNATNYNSNAIIKEFGITVGTNFERIEARILPAPSLEYADGKRITARSGVWRPDNLAFISPKVIKTWYVIVMDNRIRQSDVDSFIKSVSCFFYIFIKFIIIS
jgi:eukaryotic translation initiation factor 2C